MPLTHDTVISLLAEVTGADEKQITPQTTLLDIEMDSLLLIEVTVVLAEHHGIDLADNLDVTLDSTIADLVQALAEQSSNAAATPSTPSTTAAQ
ncbi:acyl carrier protein [Streptomyces mutabilis]|uniref:acyl carrier protein n=1 Tax=Streptomyces mutabilis TaxID=67332 RepID=UPI0022BA3417|nr:acyl carrier protein [Streptomyces mutabilis]MCZ9355122.1 acyl carrier protein [Streptomyces mutabilis]